MTKLSPAALGNPHINGVRFAELNSYDIRGLSAIVSRTVPHNMIRYILAATGEGRQQLRLHPVPKYLI